MRNFLRLAAAFGTASCLLLLASQAIAAPALKTSQVHIKDGTLEGVVSADDKVRTFKGIPYAAPPIGLLRWKEPQPVAAWSGLRNASEYGKRCMQGPIYADMVFHDEGPSEDCLYLNLWMPAHPTTNRLPVMVWIHGGGFAAGSSSEPRQDGGNLSKQGVLIVSMNYRLGIFGFFAHPELTKESSHNASGDYGLLDQVAALRWVHDNIAAFGGDPNMVTIFGQSAGSSSVSDLVASPLANGLFVRAIGESGSALNRTNSPKPLLEAEEANASFAKTALGTDSLAELRQKPAEEVLKAALDAKSMRFTAIVDGYFLPESPLAIYAAGKQSHVPLLAGWNADEGSATAILGKDNASPKALAEHIRSLYPEHADETNALYPATTEAQAKRQAEELARDRAVGYAMWKWLNLQAATGGAVTYRYEFDRARPLPPGSTGNLTPRAFHSAEIEYVFSVLPHKETPWPTEDRQISGLMSAYWANFAKTGNPNGPGLPQWPRYDGNDDYQVMYFKAESKAQPDKDRARFMLLDRMNSSTASQATPTPSSAAMARPNSAAR